MFVKFEKELPSLPHKVGDVAEFPDAIGRSYVDGGYGKEVSVSEHLQARQAAAFADLKDQLTRTVQDAMKKAPEPPHTLHADSTTPGEAAADRGKKGTGDLLRCIGVASIAEDDGARAWARTRLEKSYGLVRTKWEDAIARDGAESGPLGAQTYGYLVPPQFIPDVFQVMTEASVMTNLNTITVGSGVEIRRPALDQYNNPGTKTSAQFGGVVLYRSGESAPRVAVDASLDEIVFKATDLTGLTKVSRDMLADSMIALDSFLGDLFGRAFAWRKDYDYINGTGAGEPLGFRNSAALATVTRTTSSHVYYEDLAGMVAKIHPACYGGLRWIANPTTMVDILSVKTSGGTFAYQPNVQITQADRPQSLPANNRAAGLLLGYPLYLTEKVPPLGTAGDINLVCTEMYGEIMRSGVEIAVSEHRYFETDQVAYRWKLRHDGRPLWRSTIKLADGANTALGCFAAIA